MKALHKSFLDSLNVSQYGYTEESSPLSLNHFKDWIDRGDYAGLSYLADERKLMREDIKNYFPEFSSSLVFLFSYNDIKKTLTDYYKKANNQFKISSYVFGFDGLDYHSALRQRLDKIASALKDEILGLEVKYSLDTQPVLERDLAFRAGLGWFGKNSMLISREEGSFFIIGALLLNKKIESMSTVKHSLESDHCGTCTKCIDACPTNAIDPLNRTLIASKCISTFTIEVFKDNQNPPEGYKNSNGEIFGCDICQEVCPWTKKAQEKTMGKKLTDKSLGVLEFFTTEKKEAVYEKIEKMTNRQYKRIFDFSPLARTGRIGMLKNIKPFIDQDQDSTDE